jgi:hypothetical protein
MLSPSTRQTESVPMWSRPMMNASASPFGCGCSAYDSVSPSSVPSPSSRWKCGRSCGVEITRISRMPASISTDIG